MKREEATALLREVIQACGGMSEQGFMLMSPNSNVVTSQGYQLHIRASLSTDNLSCIRAIVERKKLAIYNEVGDKDLFVIYEPRKPS